LAEHSAIGGPGRYRAAAIAIVALAATGCTDLTVVQTTPPLPSAAEMYAAVSDDGFNVPAVPLYKIDARYRRQVVGLPSRIPDEPGVIGVGRSGFAWSGEATIQRKEHWPTWTPPKEMVARDPAAAPYANGMKGGLDNPLGARAMYLYQGGRDTLYRIHGTNDPSSIGKAVSSGCIRMINQDVMDLYNRAPIGTKVIVLKPDTNFPIAEMFDQLFPPSQPSPPPVPAKPVGTKS